MSVEHIRFLMWWVGLHVIFGITSFLVLIVLCFSHLVSGELKVL